VFRLHKITRVKSEWYPTQPYRRAAETFRGNVEREFQIPGQRLSKRQFDEETKKMMSQLTNRIAGSMVTQSQSSSKAGGLGSAAEHLIAGGGGVGGGGGGVGGWGVNIKTAVNKAGLLYKPNPVDHP
jgi:hypothetical protein